MDMSINDKEITEKLYYSISEVSEMFDLSASTLRFWEKEFDLLKPNKNKKGNRLFTKKDIEHISRIVELVKQRGFTIQGAKEQLKVKNQAATASGVNSDVIEKLRDIKSRLVDLGNALED
jgi:DNA-binding transcriptional MerR regulator